MDSSASSAERAKRYRNLVEVEEAGGLSQADKLSELLMVAKVRPALLASRAAYHSEDLFRERTGITKCRLVSEDKFDTQARSVLLVYFVLCVVAACRGVAWRALFYSPCSSLV